MMRVSGEVTGFGEVFGRGGVEMEGVGCEWDIGRVG